MNAELCRKRSLCLSYLFSAEIRQTKIVEFGDVIGDREG